MTDNFLDKYKEEDSVSSGSGEEGPEDIARKLANQKLEPQPEAKQEVASKPERRRAEDDKVTLYTFDPRSVLETASLTTREYTKSKTFEKPSSLHSQGGKDYGYANYKLPQETAYTSSIASRYTPSSNLYQYKKDLDYPQVGARNEFLKSLQYDFKEESTFTDPKSENEFRAIAKEFDNEFGDRQRDIPEVSRQLISRIKRLQTLNRDISSPNVDMGLLKTRLIHELETTQSDLNEANNKITLLMNDRGSIKDKYCYLKLRNKELKNFSKVFQDNIRSYF